MTTRRLEIPASVDQAVCDIAERRHISSDSLIVSFITRGADRERLSWARRFILFGVSPALTAFLVVGLLSALPARFTIPGTPPSYAIFLAVLHWTRVLAETLFPWPATLIAIAAMFFGSRSAFSNLLEALSLCIR